VWIWVGPRNNARRGTFEKTYMGIFKLAGSRPRLLNILNVFVRWQQRCGLSLPILQQIVITIFISKQQKVIKALKVIAYILQFVK